MIRLNIVQRKLFLQLLLSSDSPFTPLDGDVALGQGLQILAGERAGYSWGSPVKNYLFLDILMTIIDNFTVNKSTLLFLGS